MATVQPIVVRNEVMSNPWLNYSAYLTTRSSLVSCS